MLVRVGMMVVKRLKAMQAIRTVFLDQVILLQSCDGKEQLIPHLGGDMTWQNTQE